MSTIPTTVEQILVVPTALFHEIGYFQGLSDNVAPYLKTLLDPMHTSYRPRDKMEIDPSFKQLIPYCIFRCGDLVFHYTRGTSQGEARLHAKRSIGVGGHICSDDHGAQDSPYLQGMRRELDEEILIESPYTERCVGMLNDDLTEVGKVHLGVVHIFDLDAAKVSPKEKSMILAGFAPVEELKRDRDQFETWSQICLDQLF
ncbi:MAG: phosphoesterase [Planctomycetales bacterium]